MTTEEIYLKDRIVDFAMEHGVYDLTPFEVDFIETLDNLSNDEDLSTAQIEVMEEIASKLNLR